MTNLTKVEGLNYLLNTALDNGCEWVSRYEVGEFQSEFTQEERDRLASGRKITRGTGRQAYTVVDMVAAARAFA